MTDLALGWGVNGGDLLIERGDLVIDTTLTTGVLVALFTDRRCNPEDLPSGETDRRGYWGDAYGSANDPAGSLLWLLDRSKKTELSRADAELYASDALGWILKGTLCEALSADVVDAGGGRYNIKVRIQGMKLPVLSPRNPFRVIRRQNGATLHIVETATEIVLEIEA